jgi:ABC-2 type transport system permease protein
MMRLAIVESKLLLRDPASVAIGLLPPVLAASLGHREASVLVAIAAPGLVLLPTRLVCYREQGVLRRMTATPVRPASVLFVQVAVHALVAVVGCALATAVGVMAFGGTASVRMDMAALGAGTVFALGLVIAAVAPSAWTAAGVGALVCLLLLLSRGTVSAAFGASPRPLALAVLAVCATGFGAVAAGLLRWRQHV